MKTTIAILLVLLLSGTVAYAQSARSELKADPVMQALGLSDSELELVLKHLAEDYERQALIEKRELARSQAQKLLEDTALKARFLAEYRVE